MVSDHNLLLGGAERAPETNLSVDMAGWSCRLVLDSSLGVRPSHPTALPEEMWAPGSEIRVSLEDGVPEIGWTCASEPKDLSAFLHSPEGCRFTPFTASSSHLYADSVFAGASSLELRDGVLRVLAPERWPLYLELTLTWLMLRESSLVSLHAAVCAHGDTALVLLGPSKCGKSTLASALAAQGADFFNDERAFIDRRDGRLFVRARGLALRPGGRSLLESPPTGHWYQAKPDDPKYAVSLPRPTRPCPQESVLLFFLDGFGPPALQPIPGGEAALRLARGMGHGDPAPSARLEAAAEIVTRHPCRRLIVGPPDVTARILLSFAEQMA